MYVPLSLASTRCSRILAAIGMQRRQLLEHVGVGGEAGLGLLAAGQPQLVEEQLLQLLGRAEVDLAAGQRAHLLLDRVAASRRRRAPSVRSVRHVEA